MSKTNLPILTCPDPKCGGRMIVRSTRFKKQKTKYFSFGQSLGEVHRYRYCDSCGYGAKTVHSLAEYQRQVANQIKVALPI